MPFPDCVRRLSDIGISIEDAHALRRISMTLHRWHELECGDGNGHGSWTIARGKWNSATKTFEYADDGAPYLERHYHDRINPSPSYVRIPDRERGALKRLATIMQRHPNLTAYVQGDPRGASLYVLRNNIDIPAGATIDSCYSRGVAVHK